MNLKKVMPVIRMAQDIKKDVQSGTFFHVSVAIKGGAIIEYAFNDYNKRHPYYKFGVYKPTKTKALKNGYKPCLHAEVCLIKKLLNSDYRFKMHKLTVVNIRINNRGELAMSAPCPNCTKQLIKYNFRRVFFTTGDPDKPIAQLKFLRQI